VVRSLVSERTLDCGRNRVSGGSAARSRRGVLPKREQELIAKLQQRGREEASRQHLAARTGVADEEILRDLEVLGYTPETVMLLHLVPLLHMACAEGCVSDRERSLIIEAARARGIEAGSAADRQLATWLTTRPPSALFEKSLSAIGAILQARPLEEREATGRDLLAYSVAIATASGGILGLGKVSPGERRVLARITEEIECTHDRVVPPASPPDMRS
jgi:hypothetical protein